jgi:hypothetical protein
MVNFILQEAHEKANEIRVKVCYLSISLSLRYDGSSRLSVSAFLRFRGLSRRFGVRDLDGDHSWKAGYDVSLPGEFHPAVADPSIMVAKSDRYPHYSDSSEPNSTNV